MLSLLFSLPQFIILIISLPVYRRLSAGLKCIAIQAGFSLLADLTAFFCIQFWSVGNEFIYNIYMIGEFIFISSAIYFSMQDSIIRKIIQVSLIAFPAIAITSYLIISYMEFNHFVLVLSFLLLSVYNLIYLIFPDYRIGKSSDPMIWVSIGHVIYFLGVTPYFAGRELMINSRPDLADELFSYINIVLAFCRYFFIGIGFITLYLKFNKTAIHD